MISDNSKSQIGLLNLKSIKIKIKALRHIFAFEIQFKIQDLRLYY